jgi:NAD(P)-dependent dehydrogenase (short-subunit alcohol dehydrogenase family)
MNLTDKVALVTGSAHRVGKAIALALVEQGAHIVVHYGSAAEAAQEAVQVFEALGVRALPVQADLRDPDQIASLFAAVANHFGRLDVLVNSAANFVKKPFEETTLDDWKAIMQTNIRAPFFCTQHAARLMRRVDRPKGESALIVNIADLSGIYPWKGYGAHGISKAGIIHLTKVSALELGPGVRVNAIAPGAVLPPPGMDPAGEAWQTMGDQVPLKRTGDPRDVAQTVVYLAQNDYITGAVIPVDGGEHLVGSLKA